MKREKWKPIPPGDEQKQANLEAAASGADIHARPVVFGTLIVEK